MHCSLFDAVFRRDKPGYTCSRIDSKSPAPHKPEGEIPTTKTAIHPWITEMLNKSYGKFPPPSKKEVTMLLWLMERAENRGHEQNRIPKS